MRGRCTRSLVRLAMVALALAALAVMAGRQPAFASDERATSESRLPTIVPPDQALDIANLAPAVIAERRSHPDLRADQITFLRDSHNWGVTYATGDDIVADVTIDGRSGRILESWRGIQAASPLARGQQGYFGEKFDSWYVWLPFCLLFLAPFIDPRRPFRMLHLDLLVLLAGFGASHFFFNRAEIGTSVPLVYPVLAYLLVRMLVAGFRPRRDSGPLVPFAPAALLVAGIVLLGGVRIGLDLAYGTVSDVGYGGAIGATRLQDNEPLYVDSGDRDEHLDTYGPVNYLAYDPFTRVWPPTQQQIEQPVSHEVTAARAATLTFDAFTIVGLFLLGLRLRPGRAGRMLGLALAYGWVSFPYTLFPVMSNTNETLFAALLVGALLSLTSAPARGAMIALAGAVKFAPLALAPLFASGTGEHKLRSWCWFGLAAAAVVAITVIPYIPADGGLQLFYDQTVGFQLTRESPFSIWGQNPGLEPLQLVVKVAAVALAVAVAFVPRRRDAFQVAALGAAVLLAAQLFTVHWVFAYIVWFAPFMFTALFGEYSTGARRVRIAPVDVKAPAAEREPELAAAR